LDFDVLWAVQLRSSSRRSPSDEPEADEEKRGSRRGNKVSRTVTMLKTVGARPAQLQ
jgi:hypothetical protein